MRISDCSSDVCSSDLPAPAPAPAPSLVLRWGAAGAKLLHSKYSEFAGNQSHISVRFFEHTWPQPSVIARIEGTGTRPPPVPTLTRTAERRVGTDGVSTGRSRVWPYN